MKKTPALIVWDITDALEFIRGLQPKLREFGYHALLGGGVLNAGLSKKDLDIFLVPLNGHESKPREALGCFQSYLGGDTWGDPIRDSPDYQAGEPWHWQEMLTFLHDDRRIDLFIQ